MSRLALLTLVTVVVSCGPQELVEAPTGEVPPAGEAAAGAGPTAESEAALTTYKARQTYTHWQQPKDDLFSLEHNVTVESDPGPNAAYFYSHQIGFVGGSGAYIGIQNTPSGKQVIFSIWDALGATSGGGATWCQTFGGEGVGYSCRLKYEWVAGRTYRLRVWNLGNHEWGGWIRDNTTGVEIFLGKIRVPASWRGLSGYSVMWTEYFGYLRDCHDQPLASVRFEPPVGNAAFTARHLKNAFNDGNCISSTIWPRGTGFVHVLGARQPMRRVALQASNGQYVAAEFSGGGVLNANRNAIGTWETFGMVDLGNNQVALQAENGMFVSAVGGGGTEVNAGMPIQFFNEIFTRVDLPGGKVAFKTLNGHYLCAEYGGGTKLVANRTAVGAWESFTLIRR